MTVDIAAVINLHHEGRAAAASITSAWRAVEAAQSDGLSATLLLVLDDPNEETSAVAAHWSSRDAAVLQVAENDLGSARNAAVERTDARWLAFLDADDLWGEDWLTRAHAAAMASPGPHVVWHPALNVIFGDHHSLLHHVSSDDPTFSWSRFRLHNMWTALSFASHQTLTEVPYPRNDLAAGFGYEDWAWNLAILDHGGSHQVVPHTCHFIRRTVDDSLLSRSRSALRSRPARTSAPRWHAEWRPGPDHGYPITPDAHTHVDQPVDLSDEVLAQVRLASTIEPLVADTLRADGHPRTLPQNRQTHVLLPHLVLDELEAAASEDRALSRSVAELVASSNTVDELSDDERARVIAEFLIEERRLGRRAGRSSHLDQAYELFPQISA